MQAIGFETSLPITDAQSLLAFEAPMPSIAAHEVLVKIEAIAVNPVDIKIRNVGAPPAGEKRILGWDAAGVVTEVGSAVYLHLLIPKLLFFLCLHHLEL